jgi:3'-5' exoribonuclease
MTPGQAGDFFALLAERTRSARRDGKPYYTCRFRDARRQATLMVWSDGPWFAECDSRWQEGAFYKLRAVYQEHPTYGPQIDVEAIRPVTEDDRADGFDPLQLVDRTVFDVEAMYSELWMLAEATITDVPLRRLVLTLLTRTGKKLKQLPATQKHFYPFAGGLLEHTLSVTHSCIHLVDKYRAHYADMDPPLNRDLVIAAAICHDMGRTLELGDEVQPKKTVEGELFGHLLLCRDLIRDVARELGDVDAELVRLLEHIVLTHLTLPEWGSPRLPVVPECLILHHADDLDAKLEMYVRCLSRDQHAGPFTARDPILGKALYKQSRPGMKE